MATLTSLLLLSLLAPGARCQVRALPDAPLSDAALPAVPVESPGFAIPESLGAPLGAASSLPLESLNPLSAAPLSAPARREASSRAAELGMRPSDGGDPSRAAASSRAFFDRGLEAAPSAANEDVEKPAEPEAKEEPKLPGTLPFITLDDALLPKTNYTLSTDKKTTIALLQAAHKGANGRMLLIGGEDEGPDGKDKFAEIASLVTVERLTRRGGKVSAKLKVVRAAAVSNVKKKGRSWVADAAYPEQEPSQPEMELSLMQAVKTALAEISDLMQATSAEIMPSEIVQMAFSHKEPEVIANFLSQVVPMTVEKRRALLAENSVAGRLRKLLPELKGWLPESEESDLSEAKELRGRAEAAGMTAEAREVVLREIRKLERGDISSELATSRNYVSLLLSLPWKNRTEDRVDMNEAKAILDRHHAGLAKVKRIVLRYLAQLKRTGGKSGKILCFVGAPGGGKTSVAEAIAEATGRKFLQAKLGGVHDEGEIRGHDRSYTSALPGKIIRQMRRGGSMNPVFLLDEIDKLAHDGQKGDPAAALLEVLDPKQNRAFVDHYVEVPYDLSQVLFITTANSLEDIPPALRDRLEIVEFPGYTTREKVTIAQEHLIPGKLKAHGFEQDSLRFSPQALIAVIEGYTRESGVRKLEQKIDEVLGEIGMRMEQGEPAPSEIGIPEVEKALGPRPLVGDQLAPNDVGIATGLAYTSYGGVTMNIEVSVAPGKGLVNIRKQMLRMTEDSAKNAVAYLRSIADKLGIKKEAFSRQDIDITFTPDDEIDGPSAGIAMVTAVASRLTGRKVKAGIAMTGEVTVTGRVLAIGGLREKVLAAEREGIHTVLYPANNQADIAGIPEEVRAKVKLVPVTRAEEVLELMLEPATEGPAAP